MLKITSTDFLRNSCCVVCTCGTCMLAMTPERRSPRNLEKLYDLSHPMIGKIAFKRIRNRLDVDWPLKECNGLSEKNVSLNPSSSKGFVWFAVPVTFWEVSLWLWWLDEDILAIHTVRTMKGMYLFVCVLTCITYAYQYMYTVTTRNKMYPKKEISLFCFCRLMKCFF